MTQPEAEIELLRHLDNQIDEAGSAGDFDALAEILADDFRYTHANGSLVQTKDEWIEGLRRLAGRRRRVPSDTRVEIHGDVAVVTANLDIVWSEADRPTGLDRYVRVYRRSTEGWKAISQRTFPAADRHDDALGEY